MCTMPRCKLLGFLGAALVSVGARGQSTDPHFNWATGYSSQGIHNWARVECGGQGQRCPCYNGYYSSNGSAAAPWHSGSCATNDAPYLTSICSSSGTSCTASTPDTLPPVQGAFQSVSDPGNSPRRVLQVQVRYLDSYGNNNATPQWTRNEVVYSRDRSGTFAFNEEGWDRWYTTSVYLVDGTDQTGSPSVLNSWHCSDANSTLPVISYYPQGWQNCPSTVPNSSYEAWATLLQWHTYFDGTAGACGNASGCAPTDGTSDNRFGLAVGLKRLNSSSTKLRLYFSGPQSLLSNAPEYSNYEMWTDDTGSSGGDGSLNTNSWYSFKLHVRWSARAPTASGDTNTGRIELWVARNNSSLRKVVFGPPDKTNPYVPRGCPDSGWRSSDGTICYVQTLDSRPGLTGWTYAPSYMKQGLYRNPSLTDPWTAYYADTQDLDHDPDDGFMVALPIKSPSGTVSYLPVSF